MPTNKSSSFFGSAILLFLALLGVFVLGKLDVGRTGEIIIVTATPPHTPTATSEPTEEPTPTAEGLYSCVVGYEMACGNIHPNSDFLGNVSSTMVRGRVIEVPGLMRFTAFSFGQYGNPPFGYCKDYNNGCKWEIHYIDGEYAYCIGLQTNQFQRYVVALEYSTKTSEGYAEIHGLINNSSNSIRTVLPAHAMQQGSHEALWLLESTERFPGMDLCISLYIPYAVFKSGSYFTFNEIRVEAVPDGYGGTDVINY